MYNLPKLLLDMPHERLETSIMQSLECVVTKRPLTFTLDEELSDTISRVVACMQSKENNGLIISGGYGTGKSTIFRAIRKATYLGSLKTAEEIVVYYKASENWNADWTKGVLFIDDLGIEPRKCKVFGEERDPLAELLCARYDAQLPTFIATNLSEIGIQKRYGDRVYDRILEQYHIIELTKPSYRSNILWETINE